MLRFAASTVLKQIVAPHTSMPTHAGGFFGVAVLRRDARQALSARTARSMPSLSNTARLVAASAQTTSAFGLAFSASSFAVMTPVESRTQLISMSGFALLNAFLVGLELVGLERRVDE